VFGSEYPALMNAVAAASMPCPHPFYLKIKNIITDFENELQIFLK
jgi:hypothetical protein